MINQSYTQNQSSHLSRSSTKGMTLIEMMIVVVIITVLTTLALMGYKRLIYQARNAEARNFLGAIRAAQNVYYQFYG
jgi:prepilin-type N-terminal cleavage/methylation domain-containing protein